MSGQQTDDTLKQAIARNSAVVLSLPSAGILRHHKSRFLAETADGFVLESIPGEQALIVELIEQKKPVGVSFKSGVTKVVFTTPISRLDPAYSINATTTLPALFLSAPAQVKAVQRRTNYRVAVPTDCELSARVWRISKNAHIKDRPMAAQQLGCTLRDISLGGLGVTFQGNEGEPPKVTTEDRLRIELSYGDTNLLLEGRMCHARQLPDSPMLRAGVQFKALQNDIEGRQAIARLTRIVGELQREEVRRHRLGVA